MKRLVLLIVLAGTACAPAKVVGPKLVTVPVQQPPPVVVVVEPFFENARTETDTQTQDAVMTSPLAGPQPVQVSSRVEVKPLYARVAMLERERALVIAQMRKLRPDWQVAFTRDLQTLSGRVRLVRVIVGDVETLDSDRAMKSLLTAIGVVVWPLLFVNVNPVHETHRVHGTLVLYDVRAEDLRGKLLKYETQPDFAVDTRGLPQPRVQPIALDLDFEEGLFGPEAARPTSLVPGFAERLAVAMVALVEGIQ